MKLLSRNTRDIWVSLYSSKQKVMEGSGQTARFTGEYRVVRSTPFKVRASVTSDKGSSAARFYGITRDYERVVTFDSDYGVSEDSVLWIDSAPTFDVNGNLITDLNGDPAVPFDHVVNRVERTLNNVVVGASRVDAR